MTTDQRKPFAPTRPGRYELRNGRIAEIICSRNEFQHIKIWLGFLSGDDYLSLMFWEYDGTFEVEHAYDIIGFSSDDRAFCLARARELAEAHGFCVVPTDKLDRLKAEISGGLCYFQAEAKHAQLKDAMETVKELIAAAATGEGKP